MSLGPSPPVVKGHKMNEWLHPTERDTPTTKLTFGKRAQILGAVATKRSIPFR
jgi:hypothetical protein